MTETQGELDFNAAPETAAAETSSTSGTPTSATRSGSNRRLLVVALASVGVAALMTTMLVRLHASPAPVDTADESLPRLPFPDGQGGPAQVFVAPKLSSSHLADKVEASLPVDASEPLSMPLNNPNARWRMPGEFGSAAPLMATPEIVKDAVKPDALMVDLPSLSATALEQDSIIHARRHNPHGLTLAAGSMIGCALETAIDSSRGGYVTCVVTDDVVSDDARVVLIERGTHVMGEYHADARLGDARIGIVWNRLRKSDGTTVDLASPGIDQQGRSGISGAVDNHWFTRIGAAVLLSIIEDGISAATTPKGNSTTLVLGNTAATGSTLSQKVLDASINMPPTITVNPGARVSILVAKDIDFQGAYATR